MSGSLVNNQVESAVLSGNGHEPALRTQTAWPYVAAGLSLLAGAVLAIVAHAQIDSGDDISNYIGYWNAFVTLAYVLLPVRLSLRQERAYKMGLDLSRTNIWFVFGQMQFWRIASEVTGMSPDDEFLITGLVFIVTDIALYLGMLMTRRDLIPPVQAESVPDRASLIHDLERTEGLTQAERRQFLDLRRRFIVHMSRVSPGGVEIDTLHDCRSVDLVVRPALFPALVAEGKRDPDKGSWQKRRPNWGSRTYAFESIATHQSLQLATAAVDYVIALSGDDQALLEARQSRKIGLYLIRQGVCAGRRSAAFERFAQQEYGVSYGRYS